MISEADEKIERFRSAEMLFIAVAVGFTVGAAGSAIVSLIDEAIPSIAYAAKCGIVLIGLAIMFGVLLHYDKQRKGIEGWYNLRYLRNTVDYPVIFPQFVYDFSKGKEEKVIKWFDRQTGQEVDIMKFIKLPEKIKPKKKNVD